MSTHVAGRLRLVFDPTGEELAAARACEAEVFLQSYGNTHEQLADEYGPYEPASTFLAVLDEAGVAHGVARLISPNPSGLKSLDDLARAPWHVDGTRSAAAAELDLASTWDVGTLGIRRQSGPSRVHAAAAVYHGLVVAARANHALSFVAILDDRYRRLLHSMGLHLHTLPGASSGNYLGSPQSTPVYAHFGSLLDHQRRIAPEAHRLITLGEGLNLVTPDPQAFLLRSRVVDLRSRMLPSVEEMPSTVGRGRGEPS